MSYTMGKLIKAKREAIGMSQSELARRLNVKPQYISNIERLVCNLSSRFYKKTARILEIHKYEFEELLMREACDEVENAFK